MSDKDEILAVLRAPHKFTLRHENGHDYRLVKPVKIKTNGTWKDGALYERIGEAGTYCRELDNFANFVIHDRVM